MSKVAFVLEGGAMRGLYTAGVLDVFMEAGIEADLLIGVSAGALFGCNYVSKQPGRVLRYNLKYVNDKRYMGVHSLITTGNIMNKEFCFDTLVNELDPFDRETFLRSKTAFYCVVTNMRTGQPEYIHVKNFDKQMEYLRASGSMPFVSIPVMVGGELYLDGSLGDSIPVMKAQELGCDKLIIVQTRPADYRKKKRTPLPANLMYGKYPKLRDRINNRYRMYNEQVEYVNELERTKQAFVMRPSKTVKVSRVEKDTRKLQEMYDLGVSDARACLASLREYLEVNE